MNLLLDTNRYRDFCEGEPAAVERLRTADTVCLAFVTLAELRAGFLAGSSGSKNERTLAQFLHRPRVRILWPDEQTTHHYARIFLQLRRQGSPIPTSDIWIAALAVQHELVLYSRDSHFDRLPQLVRA
ncbi:MAG: type II toxin-antitoxin system VapC family toxin [Spirochaetes bacterium]|nr:type II toxin-antitoxin system VapC family toxin [Spirochaetota bacterium]